jgi:hypothetical protein
MISLNFIISNPWSDLFKHVQAWNGQLSVNKAWEIEIYRSNTIIEFESKFTVRQDHAGLTIGLGLFSYTLRAQFYDTRHWDYAEKKWLGLNV